MPADKSNAEPSQKQHQGQSTSSEHHEGHEGKRVQQQEEQELDYSYTAMVKHLRESKLKQNKSIQLR